MPDQSDDLSDLSDLPDLTETEREALHEVELGVENLHRAHGHLVSFHHSTGRSMDHLDDAESLLREAGHEALADALRDEYLPRGVFGYTPAGVSETAADRGESADGRSADRIESADGRSDDRVESADRRSADGRSTGRWTYELLENYQESFLSDLVAFGDRVTEAVAGGRRHVKERKQQREWADRAHDG